MRLPALLPLATLLVTILTACQTIPTTETTANPSENPLCIADLPITFSAMLDSAVTIAEVRRHNAAWRAVCSVGK